MRKTKLELLFWVIVPLVTFYLSHVKIIDSTETMFVIASELIVALINISRLLKYTHYEFVNNILKSRQVFQPDIQILIPDNIRSWEEFENYTLFKTMKSSSLTIELLTGQKINMSTDNCEGFDEVSDYLNTNFYELNALFDSAHES